MVIVYGKPKCMQCKFTQKWLDKREVEYTYIDITKNREAAAVFRENKFTKLPIIVKGSDLAHAVEGFDVEALKALVKEAACTRLDDI